MVPINDFDIHFNATIDNEFDTMCTTTCTTIDKKITTSTTTIVESYTTTNIIFYTLYITCTTVITCTTCTKISNTTVNDFVCDNNWYYLSNNACDPVGNQDNSNSIQAIIPTILKVTMNVKFYILAKKKNILYLLISTEKSSFHTTKKHIPSTF